MNSLMVFCGLLLLMVASAWWLRLRQQQRRRTLQKRGLLWLEALRQLLTRLQQHRGLSNGYLNGSQELLVQIEKLHKEIDWQLRDILAIGPWISTNSRWQTLNEHWHKLASRFTQLDAQVNLNQHNNLIQSLLYLIDDLAQEHELLQLTLADKMPLAVAWQLLLTAAECVGQARAVGTGVVAKGSCDTLARIRLNYLVQKIEKTLGEAWRKLPEDRQQQARVRELLKCIQQQVICARPQISVQDYFALASQAIESLYAQYDLLLAQALPALDGFKPGVLGHQPLATRLGKVDLDHRVGA